MKKIVALFLICVLFCSFLGAQEQKKEAFNENYVKLLRAIPSLAKGETMNQEYITSFLVAIENIYLSIEQETRTRKIPVALAFERFSTIQCLYHTFKDLCRQMPNWETESSFSVEIRVTLKEGDLLLLMLKLSD